MFETFNDRQKDSLSVLLEFNYLAKTDNDDSTNTNLAYGNQCFGLCETIYKRFKKFYSGNYKLINIDSIETLSKDEYPYVLMFYSEIMSTYIDEKTGLTWPLTSRHGYYIWDRRKSLSYPVYSCLGKKEDKELFINLNK